MNDFFEFPKIVKIKWYYKLLFIFIKGEWLGSVFVKRYKNIIYVLDEKHWPPKALDEEGK